MKLKKKTKQTNEEKKRITSQEKRNNFNTLQTKHNLNRIYLIPLLRFIQAIILYSIKYVIEEKLEDYKNKLKDEMEKVCGYSNRICSLDPLDEINKVGIKQRASRSSTHTITTHTTRTKSKNNGGKSNNSSSSSKKSSSSSEKSISSKNPSKKSKKRINSNSGKSSRRSRRYSKNNTKRGGKKNCDKQMPLVNPGGITIVVNNDN